MTRLYADRNPDDAYYLLGGAYSLQLKANIWMDLFYSEWSDHKKAQIDAMTVLFLIFYLGVLLYGGIDSTMYSWEYGQRSPSAWRPYMVLPMQSKKLTKATS